MFQLEQTTIVRWWRYAVPVALAAGCIAFAACSTPISEVPTPFPPTEQPTALPTSQKLEVSALRASTNYLIDGASQEAAFDGILTNGWAPNEGAGAYIEVSFPIEATVTGIRLYFIAPNGSRIQDVQLTFADGSTQMLTVEDRNGWQELTVRPITTRSVRLTVLSLTPPARERDLPVYMPEIEFHGLPSNTSGASNGGDVC